MSAITQSTYPRFMAPAFEGMIAEGTPCTKLTKIAEGGDVPFGIAVVRGTADEQAMIPTAGGQDFVGLTVRDSAVEGAGPNTAHFADQKPMAVLIEGAIWALCLNGALAGDGVSFDSTSGGLGVVVGDLVQNATWETTTAAGELGLVRLR
jgi:hypothetical protein